MNHNHIKLVPVTLTIIVAFLFQSACSPSNPSTPPPTTPPENTDEINNIDVQGTDPVLASSTEEFPLPNCPGNEVLSQTLETEETVTQSVLIGSEASGGAGVEVGVSAAAKVKLEAAVKQAYEEVYERAVVRSDRITMSASPGSHIIYVVEWNEQTYRSFVSYDENAKSLETSYTYVIRTAKLSDQSREEPCPNTEPATPNVEQTQQAEAEYQRMLEEWENFSPPSLSGGAQDATLRGADAIDFETGDISAAPGAETKWDLRAVCGAEMREALRAGDGVTWVDRGVTDFEALKYREIRDANYISQEHPETGYPDLYYRHISNAPREGYVFYFKTPGGNVVKFQIMGYVMYDNNPYICRDMQIRYDVFPIVEDPPRPSPP